MALECQNCNKSISFSGERPSFCPYCGVGLGGSTVVASTPEATTPYYPGDEAHAVSPQSWEPGSNGVPDHIGGYRLLRLLGAGGMGVVYEGVSEDSGQHVAVKLLTASGRN